MPISNGQTRQHAAYGDDLRYWYVMLHLEPSVIDRQLQIENGNRLAQGKDTLLYVIPFRYMTKAAADKTLEGKSAKSGEEMRRLREIDENNTLREYLHDFLFIRATEPEINALVGSSWNREGRLHMHFYRGRSGRPIRVDDAAMQPLLRLFIDYRQRFTFVPYADAPSAGTVVIRTGLFRGYNASVMQVCHTSDGINLVLGIPVFNDEVTLKLYNCPASGVEVPGSMQRFFEPDFTRNVECQLLDILRRRVMRRDTSETRAADQERLNSLSILHYLTFEDTAAHNHFKALMLLCATLRRDRQMRDALVPAVRQMFRDADSPADDEEAFLLAVLFVATGNGEYRKSVKLYCQTHSVTSESLLQLMPLVKRISLR